MTFKLSSRSEAKLEGLDPRLVAVVKSAIHKTKIDFGVICGMRTLDEQKELAPYMVSSMKLADEVEVTVRAGFESYVQKKKEKCCTLNIEEILKEENWKKFLNLVV